AAYGARRVARLGMASDAKLAPRKVLPADGCWEEAARDGAVRMGEEILGDSALTACGGLIHVVLAAIDLWSARAFSPAHARPRHRRRSDTVLRGSNGNVDRARAQGRRSPAASAH